MKSNVVNIRKSKVSDETPTPPKAKPAPRRIKTAEEHVRDMDVEKRRKVRERIEFLKAQAELEDYQDLRDDVCSLVKNSGISDEIIHSRFGPTPQTLENWRVKKVQKPQLGKIQTTLRAIGMDIGIITGRRTRRG